MPPETHHVTDKRIIAAAVASLYGIIAFVAGVAAIMWRIV